MPPPTSLTAAHLGRAVVPAAPDESGADPIPPLTAGVDRIDALLRITEAWRGRLPTLPEPDRPQSLAEGVQAARRRLRDERIRLDVDELSARRFVLDQVLAGLR
ncbi:hypothetical protein [Cryptosporangium minutisporangium]|uniref:Uncharacterized protein n=1 Tax=Cryptosporangium minutisporangium TaxID=113569 RepID=A0ABP6SZI6_9ACTN